MPDVRWGLALVAVVAFALASPPAPFAGGEWAVVPSLAAFYAVATESRRPYLLGYCIGLGHFAWFSWSLRGVAGGALVAIVLLGAVYHLAVVAWTRGGRRFVPPEFAFGLGVAATAIVRSHMPEIPYPHGQFAHVLYEWPALLGPVAWGGEMLQNLLLGWTIAAGVEGYRSWRVGRPAWRRAWTRLSLPAGLWALTCLVAPPRPVGDPVAAIDLVAFEPGVAESVRLMRDRDSRAMSYATLAIAGPRAADPPDLVVWPESAVDSLWLERGSPLRLADGTRLAGGSLLVERDHDYSVLVVFDARGQVLGWHEKRRPVPAAERMPWLAAMPETVRRWCEGIVGYVPRMGRGRSRPPLETADGVPFGGLMCFDNAFDEVAREHVAAGARFLVVASNEIWYDQGAELDQMVAMSVFRSLETGTPLVRSTSDGRTVAVRASGEIVAPRLEPNAPGDGIRFLRTEIVPGPGALGPLAWLHPLLDVLLPLSGVLLLGLIGRK